MAIFHKDTGKPVDQMVLEKMTALLAHRGPDDTGIFIDQEVGLGHRRLSVIDLSGGHQPMRGPSGKTWVVYNGEIFNFRQLRSRLTSQGVHLRTNSDTEVILGLYETLGPSFVELLNGMFAFALWDESRRTLLLARDRVGVKPLYLWQGANCVIAASEIKSILAYPGAPKRLRENALGEYLQFRQLCDRRTLFAEIEAMAPGTIQLHHRGASSSRRYWTLPLPVGAQPRPARDVTVLAEELRSLLQDSVTLRLVSDVPLGTFSSGGLDSSLITALAARQVSHTLQTFTVGFADAAYDERTHARQVADHVGASYNAIVADAQSFAAEWPGCIWYHDQPLNHANSVLISLLSRHAKKKVTVVLTGEGADELFAGYPRYRLLRIMQMLRRLGRWPELCLTLLLSMMPVRKVRLVYSSLGRSNEFLVASNARYVLDNDVAQLCNDDPLEARIRALADFEDPMDGLMSFELETYLHNVLERMDKMSMAAGLEARVPFLDYRVVEFAASLPLERKLPLFKTKQLVKRVGSFYLPSNLVNRTKSGFGAPLARWMRMESSLGPYLDLLCERRTLERGWWNRGRLKTLVTEHRQGRDHSEALWSLLNCELWARIMLDRSDISTRLSSPSNENESALAAQKSVSKSVSL